MEPGIGRSPFGPALPLNHHPAPHCLQVRCCLYHTYLRACQIGQMSHGFTTGFKIHAAATDDGLMLWWFIYSTQTVASPFPFLFTLAHPDLDWMWNTCGASIGRNALASISGVSNIYSLLRWARPVQSWHNHNTISPCFAPILMPRSQRY